METVSALVVLLPMCSAVAYCAAIVLVLSRKWKPYAGIRALNIASVATFACARAFPHHVWIAAGASACCAVALVALSRRSSLLGALFAAAPLLAMLLTIDREFFTGTPADEFRNATIALLCVPGPAALVAWIISLLRQTPASPTMSSR